MISDLVPLFPEILLALTAMVLLVGGVFHSRDVTREATVLAILAMLGALVLIVVLGPDRREAFSHLVVVDSFSSFIKTLILLASIGAAAMSVGFLEREKIARFEFPVVLLFATIGMMMMVSANDFLSLYVGLEMQSLSLYVLASFHRDSTRATEAGLKYFMLGALASGLLLYGISLVYGFAGTTGFNGLAAVLGQSGHPGLGVVVGMVFVIAGLAFKISAVPFHMWTPDVYEGSPTPVTAFFAAGPKIAALGLITRVLAGPFAGLSGQWAQVILVISVASMAVGAFAAIHQTNIKRMMAYSSIGHVGFALVGLAAANGLGLQAVLVYVGIYLFMTLGVFSVILSMRFRGRMVEGIHDLAGLSKTHPAMAFVMAAMMFAMAGVPPMMAGFWSKVYVFMAAVKSGLWTLAILGVLASVVSAFYYLRVVKVMYFDEPVEPFDKPERPMRLVMAVTTVVVLAISILPGPLLTGAEAAARALLP